jgi:hypothetical protein
MEMEIEERQAQFGDWANYSYGAGIRLELAHRLFGDLEKGNLEIRKVENGVFSLKRKNGVEFWLFARYGEYHLDLVEEGSRLVVIPNDAWIFGETLGGLAHEVRKFLNPGQSDEWIRSEGWRSRNEREIRVEQKMRDLLKAW